MNDSRFMIHTLEMRRSWAVKRPLYNGPGGAESLLGSTSSSRSLQMIPFPAKVARDEEVREMTFFKRRERYALDIHSTGGYISHTSGEKPLTILKRTQQEPSREIEPSKKRQRVFVTHCRKRNCLNRT